MPWNDALVDSQILAVHAAVVPSGAQGEVVLFGGDEHWHAQQESAPGDAFKKTRLYDVQSHALVGGSTIPSPDRDVFCSHHAFTADGRLLICGGTSKWPEGDHHEHDLDFLGHYRSWIYKPHARTWIEVARLNRNPDQADEPESGGRWYPGCLTLGNGDVLATFGHLAQEDFRHRNTVPERYNAAANAWILSPKPMADPHAPGGGVRPLFYARAFLLPDGNVFFATPMPVDFETAASGDGTYFSTRYDPATGEYVGHKIPEPASGAYHDWSRPAVLLPLLPQEGHRPRVLFCGHTQPLRIDLGDPAGEWQSTAPRDPSVAGLTRTYSNAVLLPDGRVCLVGGVDVVDPEAGVLKAELYEPGIDWSSGTYTGTEAWTVDADDAQHTRNYHSVALLLPNGKVWVAGGNEDASSGDPDVVGVKQIELYEPAYIAVANRVRITGAPRIAAFGEPFEIELDRPATPANAERVALIRAGSVTHSTNNDQRYVGLEIVARSGSTLTVAAPPGANVAPPGNYMLWVVDASDNPSQTAPFVRIAHVGCSVFTDRSTFSEEEVTSIGGGGQATITDAVYLQFDGFRDAELPGTPSFTLTWDDDGSAVPASQVTLVANGRLLEHVPADPDQPQRISFPFHVRFSGLGAWAGVTDVRRIRVTFRLGAYSCDETLEVTKSPNPYMTDIDPARNNPGWLSTDVRVFRVAQGTTFHGELHGAGAAGARTFIKGLLDRYNSAPENASHPFLSISPDQEASKLELATSVNGTPMFNFAVAKVRYRAQTTHAQNVKAFFRMFNTVGTALHYDSDGTYRHSGPGAGTVPLLGRAGGEVVSIPFFVAPRVETVQGRPGAAAMTTQELDEAHEVRTIVPVAGSEETMYFGCWLDINQTRKRFPIDPGGGDGPWPEVSCRSVQELVRGRHQCLVTEIFFEQDPTADGETPGTSDNLSQRNLAIVSSDNPGGPASHTALHTFEIKPSSIPAIPEGPLPEAVGVRQAHRVADVAGASGHKQRVRPDELFFRWHHLPAGTEVTLSFGDVDTAEVMRLAALRLSPVAFTVLDQHTVRFSTGHAATMPVPGGRAVHIPALLSVKLPDTVKSGEVHRISVHQIDGRSRQIIGAFELKIPVSKAELILADEERDLSVLKHVASTIPTTNRWHPIFLRYIHGLSLKVDALGGDAGSVRPNPDGSGTEHVPERPGGEESEGSGREDCCARLERCLREALGDRRVLAVLAIAIVLRVLRLWLCCWRRPR